MLFSRGLEVVVLAAHALRGLHPAHGPQDDEARLRVADGGVDLRRDEGHTLRPPAGDAQSAAVLLLLAVGVLVEGGRDPARAVGRLQTHAVARRLPGGGGRGRERREQGWECVRSNHAAICSVKYGDGLPVYK